MANVLIVDDDAELGELLGIILVDLGHGVRLARNGSEGLAALEYGLPDVVILDVEMPILDGPGMAYQMFIEDAGAERIPIVLVSGYVDLSVIAARVGTPYFLPKPARLDALIATLGRALEERRPPVPAHVRRVAAQGGVR